MGMLSRVPIKGSSLLATCISMLSGMLYFALKAETLEGCKGTITVEARRRKDEERIRNLKLREDKVKEETKRSCL